MTKKKEFCLISLLLVFTLVFGNMGPVSDFHNNATIASEPERKIMLEAGTPHDPIVIDGDANFTATVISEGWSGDGSDETPYIIDGLDINLGGATGHCINIRNTRANFTIRNCNLAGASVNPGSGIYLNNVTNAKLTDNTCVDSYQGIYLVNSDFNSVGRNNCTNIAYIGI